MDANKSGVLKDGVFVCFRAEGRLDNEQSEFASTRWGISGRDSYEDGWGAFCDGLCDGLCICGSGRERGQWGEKSVHWWWCRRWARSELSFSLVFTTALVQDRHRDGHVEWFAQLAMEILLLI